MLGGGGAGAAGFVPRLRGRSGTDRRGEGGAKPERVSRREEKRKEEPRPGIREELATPCPFAGPTRAGLQRTRAAGGTGRRGWHAQVSQVRNAVLRFPAYVNSGKTK